MAVALERPPIADHPLSAVLTYDSPEGVAAFVSDLTQLLDQRRKPYEIILVGLETSGIAGPHVRHVGSAATSGYGQALAAGLAASQHPLVLTMPAHAGYQAADVTKLLEVIDEVDVACGQHAGRSRISWLKDGFWAWLLLGVPVQDPHCPVRLYRRSILERVALQAQGKFVEIELLAKTNFLNAIMTEVEVQRPGREVATKDATWGQDWRTVLFHGRFAPLTASLP